MYFSHAYPTCLSHLLIPIDNILPALPSAPFPPPSLNIDLRDWPLTPYNVAEGDLELLILLL